jgi:sec-independent protein translocase protein TatA
MSELIVVLMILLLVFGASRLPQIGEGLGRTIRNFKRGLGQDESIAVRKDAGAPAGDAEKSEKAATEDAELIDRKG